MADDARSKAGPRRRQARARGTQRAVIELSADTEIDRLRAGWDELADRVGAPPFLRPGWIEAWWRAFGKGRLQLLGERRGDELGALMPVSVGRWLAASPTNFHTPEFGLLHADRAAAEVVAGRLFGLGRAFVSLRFLSDEPAELELLQAAAQGARHTVLVRASERFPRILLEGDFEDYWRSRSNNLRRDVERCARRLRARGEVALEVNATDERLHEAFGIESLGWKGARGTAITSSTPTERFYSEIARWATERGSLRLVFLRVEDRAVAFHLALEEAGTYFPLKGGFDPAFAACSPGKLIIAETLRRAFAIGLRRYEFLGGEDAYKLRWATHTSERLQFQAFAPSIPGRAARAAFQYGRPLAKRATGALRR